MQSMQQRMMEELEAKFLGAKLEPVQQADWANAGHLYGMDDMTAMLDVRYDFQSDYCSLTFSGPLVEAQNLKDNPPTYRFEGGKLAFIHLKYMDSERINKMLDLIRSICFQKVPASR